MTKTQTRLIETLDMATLIESYELVMYNQGSEYNDIRNLLIARLEYLNLEAYEAWMLSDTESPMTFFLQEA